MVPTGIPTTKFLSLSLLLQLLVSCGTGPGLAGLPNGQPERSSASSHASTMNSTAAANRFPFLPGEIAWQIQYTGEIDTGLEVEVFNLDLFDTPPSVIEELHRRRVYVICYFSAGSFEDWRADAANFPGVVLGKDLQGWPGEQWLDVSRIDLLSTIMDGRLDLAVEKGCDGADPDNVDGYADDTGFPLLPSDQLAFNIYLSNAAHARGLAIGLKNDMEQIPELLPYFDWMLNEECFSYGECTLLLPYVQAGKPVFVIEYELSPDEFCTQANQMGFNALLKHWELDAYAIDCHTFDADR